MTGIDSPLETAGKKPLRCRPGGRVEHAHLTAGVSRLARDGRAREIRCRNRYFLCQRNLC
jgi:hypothetical protein